ncbi:MAG: chemotaxis protein, partial [Poseidonibacter sp.]
MFFKKKKDQKVILDSLEILEQYLKNDINSISTEINTKSKYYNQIESKLHSIVDLIQNKNQTNLTVYGEIML